jgi:hypothetical protein
VVEDHELVAQSLDQVELVAGEQHRHARVHVGEQCGHRVDGHRVQAAERLVQHQGGRAVDQRGGNLYPLLVAQRQCLEHVAAALGKTEPVQQLVRPLTRDVGGEPVQPCEEHQLVGHPHLRIEATLLRHVAERPAHLLGQCHAVPEHLARGRGQHAHDDAHRRRLAGTVAADEAGQPAGFHVERHVVQCKGVSEASGQRSHAQHRRPFSGVRAGTR